MNLCSGVVCHEGSCVDFCPYVFFALRQKLGRMFLVFAITFFMFGLSIIINIIWVRLTEEYKSFEKLPKGTFISVFFPFATLFKYKRAVLGFLSVLTWVVVLVSSFMIQEIKESMQVHVVPNVDDQHHLLILFACIFLASVGNFFLSIYALMKCIGASLAYSES
ncbi:hypothetical protein [Helicobacter bizzozeronii]|uniref:hypothetical protein n=1 Tax=Helicobacter bizzozeronii TaxID=56877 RepID=UPI00131581F2|nr:hypothetical protein [Helicobacter bizzozeronii]